MHNADKRTHTHTHSHFYTSHTHLHPHTVACGSAPWWGPVAIATLKGRTSPLRSFISIHHSFATTAACPLPFSLFLFLPFSLFLVSLSQHLVHPATYTEKQKEIHNCLSHCSLVCPSWPACLPVFCYLRPSRTGPSQAQRDARMSLEFCCSPVARVHKLIFIFICTHCLRRDSSLPFVRHLLKSSRTAELNPSSKATIIYIFGDC